MIPLHVLTGFLGAGKTTLLSALLQDPRGERIAVLVNEVGNLALDHHLMERIDEDVIALPSGCVCCTIRSELAEALERVLALKPTRIVLETTGLADPAPILHALCTDLRLANSLVIAGVIAVVDAARIETLIDAQPEVRRQLELADRVVLTKGDLVPERVVGARALLAEVAPGCEVREAIDGRVDPAWLLASAPLEGIQGRSEAHVWLHHAPHDPAAHDPAAHDPAAHDPAAHEEGTHDHPSRVKPFRTHAVQLHGPARIDLIQLWLRLVTQWDGRNLLRIKGLVECADTGDVFVIQSAEHALSPPRRLAHRPAGVRGVQMVVIERGMQAATMERVLATLREAAAATPAR